MKPKLKNTNLPEQKFFPREHIEKRCYVNAPVGIAILNTVEKLKKLTGISNIINHNITRNYIKSEFRKQKIPTSIIGERLATDETMGILETYKAYHKVNNRLTSFSLYYD